MKIPDFNFSAIKAKIGALFSYGHKDSNVVNAKSNMEIKPEQKANNITNNYFFGDATKQVLNGFSLDNKNQLQEDNVKLLNDRASEIPAENLQEAETYKIDNAVRKLQTVSESTLANMFAELIAKAADNRYSNEVSPRYQEILSSLSPADAKLLEFLLRSSYIIKSTVGNVEKSLLDEANKTLPPERAINLRVEGIPFIEVRVIGENDSYKIRHYIFTDLSRITCIDHSDYDAFSAQINNLESLGLLVASSTRHAPVPYDELENHPYISNLKNSGIKIKTIKGKIDLTDLGRAFLKIVLKQESN